VNNPGGRFVDDCLTDGEKSIRWEYVNIRNEGSLTGQILGELKRGSAVTILEKGKEDIIDSMPGVWLKIKYKGENVGWIWGASIYCDRQFK